MSALSSFVSSLFNYYSHSVLGQQKPLERSVAGLNIVDRESLLHEVSDCLRGLAPCAVMGPTLVRGNGIDESSENSDYCDIESGIYELETVLTQCRALLIAFEVKERFLGMRICTYRRRLEEMGKHDDQVASNKSCSNLENINDVYSEGRIYAQQGRYCRDELLSVEKVYIEIIAQLEMLRRKIHSLEDKMKNYISMRDECRRFVLAAVATDR